MTHTCYQSTEAYTEPGLPPQEGLDGERYSFAALRLVIVQTLPLHHLGRTCLPARPAAAAGCAQVTTEHRSRHDWVRPA